MSKSDTLRIAKKILKNTSKFPYESVKESFVCNDGYQYVTDTFSCLAVKERLDIPFNPGKVIYLDLYFKPMLRPVELEIPDKVKLQNYIKYLKATKSPLIYYFREDLPGVNIQYLYDMLIAVEPEKILFETSKKNDRFTHNQYRFLGKDKKGFIMVIRSDHKHNKTNLEVHDGQDG